MTIKFSIAALENIAETGTDVNADLARLRAGETTEAELLSECLDGADDDRVQGWHDYVDALVVESGAEVGPNGRTTTATDRSTISIHYTVSVDAETRAADYCEEVRRLVLEEYPDARVTVSSVVGANGRCEVEGADHVAAERVKAACHEISAGVAERSDWY